MPCGVCGEGHIGGSRDIGGSRTCRCCTGPGRWVGVGEQCMVVARVVLGDCHVVLDYDEVCMHITTGILLQAYYYRRIEILGEGSVGRLPRCA